MVDFAPSTRPRTLAERLALLPQAERSRVLAKLDDEQLIEIVYDWRVWARAEQLAPAGEWNVWGVMSGRGAGKTRMAGEWFREQIETGEHKFSHLVGRAAGDVRKTMIEGESGLLAICHPDFYPKYEPSKKRLTWPDGSITLLFNSTEPEELRGPQCSLFWGDEIATWKRGTETWDNLMFGFRLGAHPQGVFTTTPKPVKLVRDLVKDPRVVWSKRMSTYDNIANLAATFISEVLQKYKGTRLERQEILGELLLDMPGALWTLAMIDDNRVSVAGKRSAPSIEEMAAIAVAIDPAVTSGEDSNETGIIVAGRDRRDPAHYYVWRDISGRWTAPQWAKKALKAYHDFGADRIVAEVNNGGDLVEEQIRRYDPDASYRDVRATRGKYVRGEPVAALYEQHRVHHVGAFAALEDQMVTFLPDDDREADSPDRADALIWCITHLSSEYTDDYRSESWKPYQR